MRRTIMLVATMGLTVLVASGVALAVTKIGTNGPDTLIGTNESDNLFGRGGNDKILGSGGRDNLLGGSGKDIVGGSNARGESKGGDKNMVGGSGNDAIIGGNGSDNIVGGAGNDWLHDGFEENHASKDTVYGADGNDVIDVIHDPALADLVVCGRGIDLVIANRTDVIAPDCEKVFIGRGSFDAWVESIPQSFWEELHPRFAIQ